MKKNKFAIFIIIILIIIGIVFVISKVFENNNTHKLAKIYEDLNKSQTYLFEMEQQNDNKTIMAKKDNKTIIDQYTKDSHMTTLVKDNNTYLILHDRKEYYIYEQNNVEQSILTDGIKEVIDKNFTKGKEKINGKKYYYEEYSGSTTFMISNVMDINEEDIKTRFYFDSKDNLVYIKTLHGEQEELLKINLSNQVDDSMFEIPSDYAEN